jgi:histidinol-phosphate aminotransferase
MIKREFNKSYNFDKLRLHSSERNSNWNDIFEEFRNSLSDKDIRFYPNLESLIEPLSNFFETDNFIFGTGSDRCIKYFFELNKNYKNLIISNPSFPMYSIYAQMFNINVTEVPYKDLYFPINDFLKNIKNDSIVVLSNPSSPVGDLISKNDLYRILDFGVPTLIDEAYIEFSDEKSMVKDINNFDNLYVTRTFSKAFGSAGARFGLIFSNKKNIEKLYQYRDMYETNGMTMKWILTLLNHMYKSYDYISVVKNNREILFNEFKKRGYDVIMSNCNWIHVRGIDTNKFEEIIFKENCYLPNLGNDWIRLQITDKINDYLCLLE